MNRKSFNMKEISKYRTMLFAIAITLIVFHHLTFKFESGIIGKAYSFFRVTGAFGVDVFLFLSGLGCYFSFSKDEKIFEFYKRRLIRILPAYFIVAIPAYFVTDILIAKAGVLTYLEDVTLISFWIDGGSDWYIAASLALYLLFPIIYKFTSKIKYGSIILFGGWIIVSMAVCFANNSYFVETSRFWARIPVFFFGVMIAPKVKEGIEIQNWNCKIPFIIFIHLVALLVEAGLALKGKDYAYSFTARLMYCPLAISFVLILSWFLSQHRMLILEGILAIIGESTLEIYMLNQRMIEFCTYFGQKMIGGGPLLILLYNLIGVGVTILLSIFLHKVIMMVQKNYHKNKQLANN